MTPAPMPPPHAAAPQELPHAPLPAAPILSYLANISTPTRVRLLAARIIKIIAWCHFMVALVVLLIIGLAIWKDAHSIATVRAHFALLAPLSSLSPATAPAPPPVPSITAQDIQFAVRHNIVSLLFLLPIGMATTVLFQLVGPIRRGRRAPSMLACLYLAPWALGILVVLVAVGSMSLLVGVGYHFKGEPVYLWWLLLLPPGILLILLLKDLCAFLLWIASHPMADKTPVAFLPSRSSPPHP